MPELNSYSEMEEIKSHVAPQKTRIEMVWWRMRVSATAFALVAQKIVSKSSKKMVLAGQRAGDCKSPFVLFAGLAWALWTANPNGVSGSIPLMNESETERKKMQVKRDENHRLVTCRLPFQFRYWKVLSDPTEVISRAD